MEQVVQEASRRSPRAPPRPSIAKEKSQFSVLFTRPDVYCACSDILDERNILPLGTSVE